MNVSRRSTKISLLLVSSLTVMAGATIAPALPAMQRYFSDLEYIDFWVRLVLTLPALFIVLAGPLSGYLADRWGRTSLLIPALVLYGIAGSSGLYLQSLNAILIGRALLGVAVAGIMTSATTLIADYYRGDERSQFMGWQAAFMSFGGIVFLTAGGFLAELNWHWPFAIYLLAILLIPFVFSSLPEPSVDNSHSDPSTTDTTVDSQKLKYFIYGTAFVGMIIFYLIPIQIPFYLEQLVGAGPTASGLAISVSTLFGMATSLSYGRFRKQMHYISILAINIGLVAAGYLLIGLATNYILVIAGLALCGLGMGLLMPNLNVWLTSNTSTENRGKAVGGLTTAIFLGQFLSPILSEPVKQFVDLPTLFLAIGAAMLGLGLFIIAVKEPMLSFITNNRKEFTYHLDPTTNRCTIENPNNKLR